MYSIMSGDWKEDVYSVHRKGSPTENSLVVCGLTMEQAKAVRDELNLYCPPDSSEEKMYGNYDPPELTHNEKARNLAIDLSKKFFGH